MKFCNRILSLKDLTHMTTINNLIFVKYWNGVNGDSFHRQLSGATHMKLSVHKHKHKRKQERERERPVGHTRCLAVDSWTHQQVLHILCEDWRIVKEKHKANHMEWAYQAIQTSGVLEHQPLIANHLASFCSEMQHIRPSSSACREVSKDQQST